MTSPALKNEASPEVLDVVDRAEKQCNNWAQNLAVSDFSYDVAAWGSLTAIVASIEEHIKTFGHGSQEQREAMINLGRGGALLLDKVRHTTPPSKAGWLRWTKSLSEASRQAVLVAHSCSGLISCLSMWHKNRQAVQVLSPSHLRFSAVRSLMERRVGAYQQGRRVPGWPSTPDNPVDKSFVDSNEIMPLLSRLWGSVTLEGALAMRYPDDSELLSHLRDVYEGRMRLVFRRDPQLKLGAYDLSTFSRFFATLLSICSVHDYFCAAWESERGQYPFESAVMVKSHAEWVTLIASLSGFKEEKVAAMIADLTFGTLKALDIYIHPFVPTLDGTTLFLVPQFILNSRAEENILRVCSLARPQSYKRIAGVKESEMRESIKENAPARYNITGPLNLPGSKLPDIDILIKDREAETILIGELKWLQKSLRPLGHNDKNAELKKGFQQLRAIREFIDAHPTYLRECGVISRAEPPPALSYVVIARDHFAFIPERGGIWLTEFDALVWALQNFPRLPDAINGLRSYDWLPIENRDFTARFESSSVEGITFDIEVFHHVNEQKMAGAPL